MKIVNDHMMPIVPKDRSDLELMARVKSGDHKAFEEVYNRFHGQLYFYSYKKLKDREDAIDMVHEVFSILWEKREVLTVTTSLSGYLYKTVRHRIINRISKAANAKEYLSSLENFVGSYMPPADHLLRERMLQERIDNHIARLPKRMRQIFELSRNEGLSHKEIADSLQLTEQTVRWNIKTALKFLRHSIGLSLFIAAFLGR